MNNSGAPIGENGRKKLNVVESDQVDNLLERFFGNLREEGYGKIDIRALAFDVPEVALKTKSRDDTERPEGLGNAINVLTSKGIEMRLEDLLNGIAKPIKLADLKKVKAKVSKIKKEKAEKTVDENEKSER